MKFEFTHKQQQVLNARGHNVLVSAAAGSGKTAVLVERIVRMITEERTAPDGKRLPPMDIDRLLVVTFTRAAAAQMRERIAEAISARIEQEPGNRHLQRQETLLHHAQITTIDSFCTFLLRNNFSDIGLDPGFRQMDETESSLLQKDVLGKFLDAQYQNADRAFLDCVDYFCTGMGDAELEGLIDKLYRAADSHISREEWLAAHRRDYDIEDAESFLMGSDGRSILGRGLEELQSVCRLYERMLQLCDMPGGPYPYADFLAKEKETILSPFGITAPETALNAAATDVAGGKIPAGGMTALWDRIVLSAGTDFASIPRITGKKYEDVNPDLKAKVQSIRSEVKDALDRLKKGYFATGAAASIQRMQAAKAPLNELIDITLGFIAALDEEKRERNVIDFSDLERFALQILLEKRTDGALVPRKAAKAYQSYFDEILIDEYQDSNEVQELLLSTIAGESKGRYARFMVGDVKQSIYRFRNARPDIFVDKFDTYKEGDAQTERIDLDQNFRSRREVLNAVNDVFLKIMRREIGGVSYDDAVSLKPGAVYPEAPGQDPFRTELLIVTGDERDTEVGENGAGEVAESAGQPAGHSEVSGESKGAVSNAGRKDADRKDAGSAAAADHRNGDDAADEENEIAALAAHQKEALAIAQKIREIVTDGSVPVTDKETKELRPARYSDIVILLRSASSWNDAFREIFERESIPLYVDNKTGYFAAEEVREVLQYLRVIDNPRQDIPLYGALHGYFGGFTEDEIAQIRSYPEDQSVPLYDALTAVVTEPGRFTIPEPLREKCRAFLAELNTWRERVTIMPITELLQHLISDTGYLDHVRALPSGEQRQANVRALLVKAAAFAKTEYTGLFRFLRYIDQMHQFEVDYGEANVLDEKADVVRVMTIHKSKGLEFPICFVAGLSSAFAFKGKDTSGTLITDTDLGFGVDYIDLALRRRLPTLRKFMVAARIRRESLGEELRVLYVAMTRAKEKLYLVGTVKDVERKQQELEEVREAALQDATPHLPATVIERAGSYMDLILQSILAMQEEGTQPSIDSTTISVSDMTLASLVDNASIRTRRELLRLTAEGGTGKLPEPSLAAELAERFSYRYPHEDLANLYTKTTVSELKHASLEDESEQETAGEGAKELFPRAPEETLPQFLCSAGGPRTNESEKQDERSRTQNADVVVAIQNFSGEVKPQTATSVNANAIGKQPEKLTGAGRGTAIHRGCELIDYRKWREPQAVTAEEIRGWAASLLAAGTVPGEYVSVLTPAVFQPFLRSGIAARMAAADNRGLLKREQPFVYGIAADRLNPEFSHDETILIQGIIDAFFIEEDSDGSRHIVVVDYKTDYVNAPEELIARYRIQLDYYAEALESILGLPVEEKIIYSFRLQKEILI